MNVSKLAYVRLVASLVFCERFTEDKMPYVFQENLPFVKRRYCRIYIAKAKLLIAEKFDTKFGLCSCLSGRGRLC